MLEDDHKNLDIVKLPLPSTVFRLSLNPLCRSWLAEQKDTLSNSELSLYEKMAQHELLKHGQVVSGLVVHKAAQVVGKDVEAAWLPSTPSTLKTAPTKSSSRA
jgi:hypothetical protein